MYRGTWRAALLVAVFSLFLPVRPAAAEEALALTRVLLSSAGVGYFEYEAKVRGDAELPLTVQLDQVDDVLKSVVVFDDRGSVGQVTLPGKEPLDRVFRDLPFDADALGSEPELLNALRGAEVRVATASDTFEGRVLSVTTVTLQLPDHSGTTKAHRLALAGGGSVASVLLEDVRRLTFLDPTLQRQLDAALAALLQQKERDRRTLSIHSAGAGERTVRVGYVVAVPLWKTTYRLLLSADPAAKTAELQGFAIVENQSGADWKGVDLTLVSGSPITFQQALYASYHVRRPEVPVAVLGRVLPRLDEAAAELVPSCYGSPRRGAAPAPPEPAIASSTELLDQVALHFPEPVSIADGEDAVLAVVDRPILAARISLYDPDVDARHPLSSVELSNDGPTSLPPGVMTTYERAADGTITYAGDARLPTVPAGEARIASFGVDLKVSVDRGQRGDQVVTVGTLDAGVLHLTRTRRYQTHYTVTSAAAEPRTVVLQHPRASGYDLAVSLPSAIVSATAERYRIRVTVPAGGAVALDAMLDQPSQESVVVANLGAAELAAYASATTLSAPLREALAEVAALRRAADEQAAALQDLEGELARIGAEQARIRENLQAVPPAGELAQRYLQLLAQGEDRIAALQRQLDAARTAAKGARKALAERIRSLTVA